MAILSGSGAPRWFVVCLEPLSNEDTRVFIHSMPAKKYVNSLLDASFLGDFSSLFASCMASMYHE